MDEIKLLEQVGTYKLKHVCTCMCYNKQVFPAGGLEGVTLNLNGREQTIYGTLTIATADNLASQQLGGYKSLATATENVSSVWL